MSKSLFITGTGTDIGKTYVSALIVKKLHEIGKRVAYFKVAMSGNTKDENNNLVAGDAHYVKTIARVNQSLDEMCPYIYENAFSPHLAAQIEGNFVDMNVVKNRFYDLCKNYEYITIEGAGGIICPLRFDKEKIYAIDIIKQLDLACIIVTDSGLGTINSTVLTADYVKRQNIRIQGIIFNNFQSGNLIHEDNKKMCEQLTGISVLACIKPNASDLDIDSKLLESLYKKGTIL